MPPGGTTERSRELDAGRESYAARAWLGAFESLSRADCASALDPPDLELLATSAYMIGRDDDLVAALERAHHGYLEGGRPRRAVRSAFWLGIHLALRGERGPATGWLGRAQRLLEREEDECAEHGYLLIASALQQAGAGDCEGAYTSAAEAARLAERFGDADLLALAVIDQGRALVGLGRVADGLGLLDEAMVAVTAGELSPIVTGLVYCSVIEGCQEVYEPRRAQEWTSALAHWCEQQPDLVPFTGTCLVHRAELMQLHGAWPDALAEAQQAGRRFALRANQSAEAQARYRQGEIHRLLGEFAAADAAFLDASRGGWDPQPGLALLRLAQGKQGAAVAAIRRVTGETSDRHRRMRLLPAQVEIALAAGHVEEARAASRELGELAADHASGMLGAVAAEARGAVELAEGDAGAALVSLRRAWQSLHELGAPYDAARVRVLLALACHALGDDDAASQELEAARDVFEQLGARPDLARVDALPQAAPGAAHGLTRRELEVLRMVAAGATNKAIAARLVLSERTVDRHVSNIFAKLRVSTRAAATAFAYENQLV